MKLKKLLVSLLAVSMLAGCGGSKTAPGEVTINLGSEPPEMLSFLTTDTTSGNVLRHVMETLVTLDENNKVVPGVAKEVPTVENGGISADALTYTFKLNENAKWSNGDQVTAYDFEFAWTQLFTLSNGAQYASTWAPTIKGAEALLAVDNLKDEAAYKTALEGRGWKAVDDTTFVVTLANPCAYFLNLVAFYNFCPVQQKAYEAAGGLDKYGNDVEGYLCNGAFVLSEWNHESDLVLTKNDNYWNKDAIKLTKITMKMISETTTANNEFDNGTIDMIGLSQDDIKAYADQGYNVQDYSDGSAWYFEFNTTVKGLNNVKVRKALTYGFDVPKYIEVIQKNNSKEATSLVPDAITGGDFTKYVGDLYNRTYDEAQYKAAKALLIEGLAEEGLTLDTFELTILGDTGDASKRVYEYFQGQWKENLGLTNVQIQQVEFQDRLNKMSNKDFGVVFAGWGPDYDDPMTFLDLFVSNGGNNHTSYANPAYDALVAKARVEIDKATRDGYLKQIEEIIATDFPVGMIYHRYKSFVTSDRLQGVVRNAFADIDLTGAYTVDE